MLGKSDALGWVGVVISIVSPYIDIITEIGKVVGAAGGAVLICLSIYLKYLQIKKTKRNEKDISDTQSDI